VSACQLGQRYRQALQVASAVNKVRNDAQKATLAALYCPAIKAKMYFAERLQQLQDNPRLQVLVQARNILGDANMRLPKRLFCEWVGSFKEASKSWCFKLRERVIILNKPANSC
jgi:hypothetical protein